MTDIEIEDFDSIKKQLGAKTNAEVVVELMYAHKRMIPIFGAIEKRLAELGIRLDEKLNIGELLLTPSKQLTFGKKIWKNAILTAMMVDGMSEEEIVKYAELISRRAI
ncbi:MAG: hypothetical protein AAB922_03775 [Patescibacteria group bacterium]